MLRNYLLLIFSALCFISTACSSDVTDEDIKTSDNIKSQKGNNSLTTKLNSSTTRASSSLIETWTGDIKIERKSKVKVIFSPAYAEYLPGPGMYICDVYTITAKTPEDPNVIYKDAVDESCGFLPPLKNPKRISRGTKAYISDDSENSYILKTVCYRIISNAIGQTPNGEYYIPCHQEEAKIKYKKLHVTE